MKIISFLIAFAFVVFIFYLFTHRPVIKIAEQENESLRFEGTVANDSLTGKTNVPHIEDSVPPIEINTKKVKPGSLVSYSKSLIGIPYKYASADPSVGFDCSGFITYVFNHYNIEVPRSSKDFENKGTEIPIAESRSGDLILFTGTDSTEKIVGHMGIITSNNKDGLKFIHSTSGKAYGVVITAYNKYYESRLVKVIRVFN